MCLTKSINQDKKMNYLVSLWKCSNREEQANTLMPDATLEKSLRMLGGKAACIKTGQRSAIVSVFHLSSNIKAYCLLNGSFYRGRSSVLFY